MSDLANSIEKLSPARRALLVQRLRAKQQQTSPGKIPQRSPGTEYIPLSFAQRRLWFLTQLDRETPIYTLPFAFSLSGPLNINALEKALSELVQRHEALRTRFVEINELPMQVVEPPSSITLPLVDLQALPEDDRQTQAQHFIHTEGQHLFDLTTGPLLHVCLLRLTQQEHLFLLSMHHIILDGWSLGIFFRELSAFYQAHCTGGIAQLPELPIQYADYALWQHEQFIDATLQEQLNYWKKQLAYVPQLNSPTDYPRPTVRQFQGHYLRFTFSQALTTSLKQLCQREGITLFMAMLAGFQILLARYSGQTDLAVGTPVANRNHRELENIIGPCVNTLVFRSKLAGNPTVHEFLEHIRQMTTEAYAHQDLPFEKLVEELNPERSLSYTPLFQVMLAWQDISQNPLVLPGIVARSQETEYKTSQFDLTLNLAEGTDGLFGMIIYDRDLFEEGTIRRLLEHYHNILESMSTDPTQHVHLLQLLTAEEVQQQRQWNATQRSIGAEQCIHHAFERQAKHSPDAVALVFQESCLTYHELDLRANQLAHSLQQAGASSETLVAICTERSLEMLIALLGTLKAGAAYVPLDPTYPVERLSLLFDDAQMPLLLTQQHLLAALPAHAARTLCLDRDWQQIARSPVTAPTSKVIGEQLCYLIYTSGSTGRPKGVQVRHLSVVNLLASMQRRLHIQPHEALLALTTLSFDIAALELFLPLLVGARVVLLSRESAADGEQIARMVVETGARYMQATPITWKLLLASGWQGTPDEHPLHVLCGGELFPRALANQLLATGAEVWNVYGPTETTIWSSMHKVTPGQQPVPIGRPVDNTSIYLLDRSGQPVPISVAGEICIGGIGVARGYLHQPELTAERFVPDAFSGEAGARLYRTGDQGRYLPDGTIDYLGRLDQQVKLHGFRIEPGEIEIALSKHPTIREAVVLLHTDTSDNQRLVAYILPATEQPFQQEEVRESLKTILPSYMIPSAFITVDRWPLTPNGKLDKRALPVPEPGHTVVEHYVAPRTPLERVLASLWAEVLRVEPVGVYNNFFALGGDSILGLRVVALARKAGIQLTSRQIFQHQTIAQLAAALESAPVGQIQQDAQALQPAASAALFTASEQARDIATPYPLSPLQEGMLFHSLYTPRSYAYHNQLLCTLQGTLIVDTFYQAWRRVIERHAVLRTAITWDEQGQPWQVIQQEIAVPWQYHDWSEMPGEQREQRLMTLAQTDLADDFELSQAPLFRLMLVRLDQERFYLLWSYHHILLDGWSIALLLKEVFTIYEALSQRTDPMLYPSRPYHEYITWLQQQDLAQAESFWRGMLDGFTTATPLPLNLDPVQASDQEAGYVEEGLFLPSSLSIELQAFGRQQRLTLNTLLQGAWALLLSQYSGEDDVLFGVITSGRAIDLPGIENMIGLFINTLPLRIAVPGQTALISWLKQVQEQSLALTRYEYCSLVKVQEWSPVQRGRPLFESLLVFENYPVEPSLRDQAVGLSISDARATEQTNYPLMLTVRPGPQIWLSLSYQKTRFSTTTIKHLLAHLHMLLESMLTHAENRLVDIPSLTEAEQRQLLEEWNATTTSYPENVCLTTLFEAQAAQTPDAVALVNEDEHLTYQELNARANQLAHYLRCMGIGPDILVAVWLPRSFELIISLLGILKAGGAYLPLDITTPSERLSFIMHDAQATVLLALSSQAPTLIPHVTRIIYLDRESVQISSCEQDNPIPNTLSQHLAYVIYTSGSTGKPKGVLVPHKAVVNYITTFAKHYTLQSADRVLQFANTSFDTAAEEIFPTLLAGAKLVLRPGNLSLSIKELLHLINNQDITLLDLPTAYWHEWVIELPDITTSPPAALRLIIVGGEAVASERLARWQMSMGNRVRWSNTYGPTEATIVSTSYELAMQEPIPHNVPIGRPVANVRVYVLNTHGRLAPIGAPGELYIAGAGLARGYLRRPELTAERFIPDPFSDQPGARLYRTGDKVRWLAHGVLEFLGRFDRQIKLRGYRIELGEIEDALRGYPGIQDAAVLLREDRPEKMLLTAYLVPVEHRELSLPELRRHLQAWVPGYMQPASYVVLKQFPLTDRGKLDHHQLPSPQIQDQGSTESYVAPQTEMQRTIASIWQQVLQKEAIGIHDNFFDLGGHSLLLNRVYSSLSTIINKELSMLELIQRPTIFALANYLSQEQNTSPSFETSHARASTRQELTRQQRQMRQQLRKTEKQKEMKHE